jgi:hypothetical protein
LWAQALRDGLLLHAREPGAEIAIRGSPGAALQRQREKRAQASYQYI